jgi:hypothetical protein
MIPVASIVLPQTMGFAHARASFLFLIVLAVGACAQLDRLPAVAVADTDRASVAGISEVRFLPSDTAAMATFGRRLHERESKYFSSLGRPIPPESLLAISGGGDNGAFGAGVLVGWSESRTRPSFKIVTGISTGALIAPLAFVGPEYDPLLSQMYTTIDQTDIFEKRPLLEGLVSDALADSTPLQHLLAKYVDANLVSRIAEESRRGRALVIITTNLDAGVPVIWNIGAIAESGHPEAVGLIRKILLASASVPGFFPPVMFDVMVDGGAHSGDACRRRSIDADVSLPRCPPGQENPKWRRRATPRCLCYPQRAFDAGLGRGRAQHASDRHSSRSHPDHQ